MDESLRLTPEETKQLRRALKRVKRNKKLARLVREVSQMRSATSA